MRRALEGMSGTFFGLDHNGQTVLAAYEPVVVLNLGIVVKMDLAEVYTPFLRSGLAAAAVGLLVILAGTGLFLRISNPIVLRLEAYSRDLEIEIEERKRVEATLRSSEERLQAVVDNSTMVIYLKDTEGRYLLINRPFEALFHVTKEEVVGKTDYDLFPEETAVAFRSHDQAVLAADAPLEFEEQAPQDDGLHTYASVKFPLPDATGKTYAICTISTDITGRKRLQDEKARLTDQLHHAQKMEAIGQLASGVAHDFNNLLQVISVHAELTSDIVESDSDIARSMQSVMAAVDQATGVTRSLLTFSRKSRAQKRSTDLCATVEQTMKMLQRTLPAMIELVVDTDCEPVPWINADPTQVQQIIVNLAVNARDAMPNGGTLHVSVSAPEFPPSKLVADGSEALHTKLALSDTGTGIPVEIRQRILEPFFTTKKSGQGTGLGLSIIHSIVEDHNAFLEVDSKEGTGSTFTVYFPCISPEPAVPKDLNKVVVPVGKSELILLAEDNQQIRDIIAATLVSHGYRVAQAADGDEVIEIFKRKKQEIRLLVLDIELPKKSGLASLQTIRRMGCRTAAILISGSTHNLPDDQLDELTMVLAKPFTMNQLGSLVVEHFKQRSTVVS